MSQDDSLPHKAWSTDTLAALELRDFISSIGCDINLTKFATSPKYMEEYIQIKDSENEECFVATSADNFPEAICRAFLLYQNKFFGEYINAKFESAMKNSKRRSAKIIEMWKNKERKSD